MSDIIIPENTRFYIGRNAKESVVTQFDQETKTVHYSYFGYDENQMIDMRAPVANFIEQIKLGGVNLKERSNAIANSPDNKVLYDTINNYLDFARSLLKGDPAALAHELVGATSRDDIDRAVFPFVIEPRLMGKDGFIDAYDVAKSFGVAHGSSDWNYGLIETTFERFSKMVQQDGIIALEYDEQPIFERCRGNYIDFINGVNQKLDIPILHLEAFTVNPHYPLHQSIVEGYTGVSIARSPSDEDKVELSLTSDNKDTTYLMTVDKDQMEAYVEKIVKGLEVVGVESPTIENTQNNYKLIAINETANWSMTALDGISATRAYGVYLVNLADAYHPADLRAHVDGELLTNEFTFKPGTVLSDEQRDIMDEMSRELTGDYQTFLLSDIEKMKHVKDVNYMINFPLDSQEDILERLRETIMGNAVFNDLGIPYVEPEIEAKETREAKITKRALAGEVIEVNNNSFILKSKLVPEPIVVPQEGHNLVVGDKVRASLSMNGDEIVATKVTKMGIER